jgi:hypothetical protein
LPLAIGPLGTDRRCSERIPANRRPSPAERGRGTACGSPRLDFRARTGRDHNRRDGSAAPLSGGHWCTCSGEGGGGGEVRATLEVAVVIHGGGGVLTRTVVAQNRKLIAEVSMAHGGGAWRVRGRVVSFIGTRVCAAPSLRGEANPELTSRYGDQTSVCVLSRGECERTAG